MVRRAFQVLYGLSFFALLACTEAVPTTANLTALSPGVAVLSNAPADPSNLTLLDITVGGYDVVTYKYAFGDLVSLPDCSDPAAYGAVYPIASPISVDITWSVDAVYRLCVLGQNSLGQWQSEAKATTHTWVKDTLAPTTPSLITLDSALSSLDNDSTPILDITSSFSTYDFVFIYNDDLCGNLVDTHPIYSSSPLESVQIASPLADGDHEFHVQIVDAAGNDSGCSSVFANYTLDTVAPAQPSALALLTPAASPGPIPYPEISVSVSGSQLQVDEVVKIYSANTCSSGAELGTMTVSTPSFSVSVTTTSSRSNGSTTKYYAQTSDPAGNQSACSTASVTYVMDDQPPSIIHITSSSADYVGIPYFNNDVINVKITFDEPVYFSANSGELRLAMNTGGPSDYAKINTDVAASAFLNLSYIVNADDLTMDFDVAAYDSSALSLYADAAVSDAAGNSINFNLSGINPAAKLASQKDIRIMAEPADLGINSIDGLDFGTVTVGNSVTKTFQLENNSTAVVNATSIAPNALTGDFNWDGGIFPGGNGTCDGDLNPGESCDFVVKFTPTGSAGARSSDIHFTFNNGYTSDSVTNTFTGTAAVGPLVVTVNPMYSGFAQWNSYVRPDGSAACDGSENVIGKSYFNCIHAGQKKKVILTGISSCANLNLTESLGVFDWYCKVEGGAAIFYSDELKDGKGLADLIDSPNNQWLMNHVEIRDGSTLIAASTPAKWWPDAQLAPLANVPGLGTSNGTAEILSTPNMIYHLNTNYELENDGFNINADGVGIVIMPGAKFRLSKTNSASSCDPASGEAGSNTISPILCSGSQKFLWIEGEFEGENTGSALDYPAHAALFFHNITQSRIHNLKVSLMNTSVAYGSLELKNSKNNLFSGFASSVSSAGANIVNSTENLFWGLNVSRISGSSNSYLLNLGSGSNYNRFYYTHLARQMGASGTRGGLKLSGANNNIFNHLNISEIAGPDSAIGLINASSNIFTDAVLSGTSDSGIEFLGGNSANNIFSRFTVSRNSWNAVYFGNFAGNNSNLFYSFYSTNTSTGIETAAGMTASSTGNQFVNMTLSTALNASNTDSSAVLGEYMGYLKITNAVCSSTGVNLTASCSTNNANGLNKIVAIDLNNDMAGAVVSDGIVGLVSASSSMFDNITNYFRWLFFENTYRNISLAGSNGPCLTGICQVYDYSLSSISDDIRDKSIDGSNINPTFNPDNSNCVLAALDGSTAILNRNSFKFMKHAIEMVDAKNPANNQNGLCESGEDCVYAPNIGAYQGHGDPYGGNFCTTVGTVAGAKIYKYPVNGY